jgi:hypothetical protein
MTLNLLDYDFETFDPGSPGHSAFSTFHFSTLSLRPEDLSHEPMLPL